MKVKEQKCDHNLVRKYGMFYWCGRTFPGLVCEECNALYDDPDDSFLKYVMENKEQG